MKNFFLYLYLSITATLLILTLSVIRLDYISDVVPDPIIGADYVTISIRNDYDSEPMALPDLERFFEYARDEEFMLMYRSRMGKVIMAHGDLDDPAIAEHYDAPKSQIVAYVNAQKSDRLFQRDGATYIHVGDMDFPVAATFSVGPNEAYDDYYLRFMPMAPDMDVRLPVEGEIWLVSAQADEMAARFKKEFADFSADIRVIPPMDIGFKLDVFLAAMDMHFYMVLVCVSSAVAVYMAKHRVYAVGISCGDSVYTE